MTVSANTGNQEKLNLNKLSLTLAIECNKYSTCTATNKV